jgi:hypothetical protein
LNLVNAGAITDEREPAKRRLGFIALSFGNRGQEMSKDDVAGELRIAPAVYGVTNLPLIGLTLATDEAWSARYWLKDLSEKRHCLDFFQQQLQLMELRG